MTTPAALLAGAGDCLRRAQLPRWQVERCYGRTDLEAFRSDELARAASLKRQASELLEGAPLAR